MTSKEKITKNHITGIVGFYSISWKLHNFVDVSPKTLFCNEGNFVLQFFCRYMEENPRAGLQEDESDNEIEYDEDGNPIAPKKSKVISTNILNLDFN